MAIERKLYTVDEFEAVIRLPENRDRNFELIQGEIVEKVPTELHGLVNTNILGYLWTYSRTHNIGRVGPEIRNRIPGDDYNARQPDISFFLDTQRPVVERGPVLQMPDLAVEVKSPDDSFREMREKADYYLANGARMVWLVYPEKRIVEIHTADEFQILIDGETIEVSDVLPGFTLPVRDIVPR